MSIYRTTIKALTRLLPQDCYVCGDPAGAAPVCAACAAGLPRLDLAVCPVCALPGGNGGPCGPCQKAPPHFDATVARFAYAFPVDRMIHGLKYRGRLPLATYFAHALARQIAGAAVDCVLPLPLHPKRLGARGFNQSLEIARPLARLLGITLLPRACARRSDGAPQASLPWKARRDGVRNAFECSIDFAGASVAVVDDVMTTGATLDELARTLKRHGARQVTNWVVARTLHD